MSRYRITVLTCAFSWFMIGLHVPAIHQMTHHGHTPSVPVLTILTLLSLVAVVGLWNLLRAQPQHLPAPPSGAHRV